MMKDPIKKALAGAVQEALHAVAGEHSLIFGGQVDVAIEVTDVSWLGTNIRVQRIDKSAPPRYFHVKFTEMV